MPHCIPIKNRRFPLTSAVLKMTHGITRVRPRPRINSLSLSLSLSGHYNYGARAAKRADDELNQYLTRCIRQLLPIPLI